MKTIFSVLFFVTLGLFHFSPVQAEQLQEIKAQLATYQFKLEHRQCARFARMQQGQIMMLEVPLTRDQKTAFLMDEPIPFPEVSSNRVAINVSFKPRERKLVLHAYAQPGYQGWRGDREDKIMPNEAEQACREYVGTRGREFSIQYLVRPQIKYDNL